ncbi:MAG: hypothetical protein ACOH1K_02630 [Rhodoglobus sp.]
MEPHKPRPDRTLIAVVVVIATIVVIALVVVFTRGGAVEVDPATPEGVVQSYSLAVLDNDYDNAREFISAEIRATCTKAEPSMVQGLRMTVISSKVTGDTAVVRVTMEHDGGSFGGTGYEYDGVFILIHDGDLWKVESAPWELALCTNQGMGQ